MRTAAPPALGLATVVVTGAAGDLGRRLLARLEADPSVRRVVALDAMLMAAGTRVLRTSPAASGGDPNPAGAGWAARSVRVRRSASGGGPNPAGEPGVPGGDAVGGGPPEVVAYRVDLATGSLAALLEGADAVVHLAWSRPGPRDRAPATTDLVGTRRLLEAAAGAGVRRIVHLSSAAVYGAWPDNPVPLTEDALVRPNPGFAYAAAKAEAERLVAEWRGRDEGATSPPAPEAATSRPAPEATGRTAAVLRPAVVLGAPRERWLSRALGATAAGEPGRPQQFVHAEDVVSAVVVALAAGLDGPANVAPDGWLAADQADALGGRRRRLRLPARVAGPLARLAFGLGVSERPPAVEPYLRHPWVVANDRLRAAGWVPRYTNAEALVAAREGSRWSRLSPKRRQELALGAAGLAVAAAAGAALVVVRRVRIRTRAARPG